MAWTEATHGHLRESLSQLGRDSRTHGASGTRAHHIWCTMKARCNNPKSTRYQYYGARGISHDPRWHDFAEFIKDMGQPPAKMSLERIDNSKGYCKDNCRWASQLDQSNNKRNNVFYTIKGKRQTLAQWQRELGTRTRMSTYKALLEIVLAEKLQ